MTRRTGNEPAPAPVRRLDFDDKVAGSARYCADLEPAGLLHAATYRSEWPRAVIRSVSVPELPEGYFLVDHTDVHGRNAVPHGLEDQPFLADGRVNYVGEPILLLAGPDREVLRSLISQIKADVEPLPPILSIDEAKAATGGFLRGDKPWFYALEYAKGDVGKAMREAATIVEDEFRSGYQEHAYLETQAVLAEVRDGGIVVSGSLQCPYYVKDALTRALGWPEERVRVVQLPTGGGFGGKEDYPSIPAVHAALLAIKSGRPVRLVFDRREDMAATTKRHPSVIRIRSGVDARGRVIAREVDIATDAGAYAGLSGVVLQRLCFSACGVYDVPNLRVSGKAYATNKVVTGAFRGFGGPQAFFAIEAHMENVADRIGADPVEFRRAHFLKKGDASSTGGRFRGDILLPKLLERVLRDSDYAAKRAAPAASDGPLRGIGLAAFFHGCGFTGSSEKDAILSEVRLRKDADGTVEVFASSAEIGQGSMTALATIAARELGIPIGRVRCPYPDTAVCPDSGPTVASRTTMIVGRTVRECAAEMRRRWDEGAFEVVRRYPFPYDRSWDKKALRGDAYVDYAWGVVAVEVEVDRATCVPTVCGAWSSFDIGRPIDPRMVRGQIEGGMTQGLGYASMEEMRIEGGRVVHRDLTDYVIPTSADFPPIVHSLADNPFDEGPFGAKGVGELSLVGAAPAYALAVQHAIGRRVREIPVTPERILERILHGD